MKDPIYDPQPQVERLLQLKDDVDRFVTESLGVHPDLLRAAERIAARVDAGTEPVIPWEEVRERVLRKLESKEESNEGRD